MNPSTSSNTIDGTLNTSGMQQHDTTTSTNNNNVVVDNPILLFTPTTNEMTILCLDYFRNTVLRNNNHDRQQEQQTKEEIQYQQYISIACWALQQSMNVTTPSSCSSSSTTTTTTSDNIESNNNNNYDAWVQVPSSTTTGITNRRQQQQQQSDTSLTTTTTTSGSNIPWPPPSMESIYQIINFHPSSTMKLNTNNTADSSNLNDEKKETDPSSAAATTTTGTADDRQQQQYCYYDYDDDHSSNLYRIYNNHFSNNYEPLTLQQLLGVALFALNHTSSSSSTATSNNGSMMMIDQPASGGSNNCAISSRIFYDTQLIFQQPQPPDDTLHGSSSSSTEVNWTMNPVFTSYFYAVLQKGYFHDCGTFNLVESNHSTSHNNNDNTPTKLSNSMIRITNPILYEEKFRKVISKFRTKYNQNYYHSSNESGNNNNNNNTNYSYTVPSTEYYKYLLQQISLFHEQQQQQYYPTRYSYYDNNTTTNVVVDPVDATTTTSTTTVMVQGIPIPVSYVQSIQQYQHRCLYVAPPPPPTVMNYYNNNIQHHDTNNMTMVSHQQTSLPPQIQPSDSMVSYFSTKTTGTNATITTTTGKHQQQQQLQLPEEVIAAEKYKHMGNTFMQQKQYHKAIDCYTQALKHIVAVNNTSNEPGNGTTTSSSSSSSHPNYAHVYYSNRAAAYISIKDFTSAIQDSERALILQPTYGKGHARLGLAYFLSGQYRNAVEAYTVALKYDPNNTSSKNYLEKSAYRLAEQEQLLAAAAGGDNNNDTSNGDGSFNSSNNNNNNTPSNYNTNSTPSPGRARQPQEQKISNSFSVISEMEHRSSTANYSSPYNGKNVSHPSVILSSSPNDHMAAQLSTLPSPVTRSNGKDITDVTNTDHNHITKEAERYKMKGNTYMSQKDYHNAIEAYGKAIQLLPSDPTKSHVYYSNRAAAFCYLECYTEAEHDASMAIKIVPTYGKAYARLGLSRFLLKNYVGAIVAYETSLQYDPNNSASQSYLIKAQQKLQQQQISSLSKNNNNSNNKNLNNSTGSTGSNTVARVSGIH